MDLLVNGKARTFADGDETMLIDLLRHSGLTGTKLVAEIRAPRPSPSPAPIRPSARPTSSGGSSRRSWTRCRRSPVLPEVIAR